MNARIRPLTIIMQVTRRRSDLRALHGGSLSLNVSGTRPRGGYTPDPRGFCRLCLDGKVPDHSTFSRNRHGRFRESNILRYLFESVVDRCLREGLVLVGIVSKLAHSRYTSGPTTAWLKTKAFTVETSEMVGVKIADNGMPYAIMANAAGEDADEAIVTMPKAERDAFWQCVEMLETR